jgi:thiol-disulfide isomerase/thioredoxin
MRRSLISTAILFVITAAGPAQDNRPLGDRFAPPHLVTIRGEALGPDKTPIAGAKCYLLSTNRTRPGNFDPLLAETTVDEQGHYTFRNVPLPILPPPTGPIKKYAEGAFVVFATAPGFGFTWHSEQICRPEKRPADAPSEIHIFHAGEEIVADLNFELPATIRGRITDEHGNPLAGIAVQLGSVNRSVGTCSYLGPPNTVGEPPRDSFSGVDRLPQESRTAVTDADGRYTLSRLRRETLYSAKIDYKLETDPVHITVATSSGSKGRADRRLGYDGTLDHAFALPRTVAVRITAANSGRPFVDVVVRARRERLLRGGNVGKSDIDGIAKLRLLPSDYELVAEPPFGAPYVVTQSQLTVTDAPAAQSTQLSVAPAALVAVQAVEAGTDRPIAGVSFLHETNGGNDREHLHSQTVCADYPSTDDRGQLRAVLRPGSRRFVVGQYPRDCEPVSTVSSFIDLVTGQTQNLRFEFRKKEIAAARAPDPSDELAPLRALVARQNALSKSGTYRLLHAIALPTNILPADVRVLLESSDYAAVPEFFHLVAQRFPALNFGPSRVTLVADGRKLRTERVSEFDPDRGSRVTVHNMHENIMFDPANRQASVSPGIIGTTPQVFGPSPSIIFSQPNLYFSGNPQLSRENGKLIITGSAPTSPRQVIDEATGFLYHSASQPSGRIPGREKWQFAPRQMKGGVMLAGLTVEMRFNADRVESLSAYQLEEAILEPPPPDAFVVSAPAGTIIVDSRGNSQSPKIQTITAPIADVVLFANRIADTERSILPVLRKGQPAPKLDPLVWLSVNGLTDAPDLRGKVVLIDFWGISCGPCVAELPDVQALAKTFAGQDFILIGLHESGGQVHDVAEFARKQGLTYQLAIDRPDPDSLGFGAAFKAYGVRGIPSCALIDREGRVALVGRFREASLEAAKLLQQGPVK